MLKKLSFGNRYSRKEYITTVASSTIIFLLLMVILYYIVSPLFIGADWGVATVYLFIMLSPPFISLGIFYAATIAFFSIKRLHDINLSGLFLVVPIVIVLFYPITIPLFIIGLMLPKSIDKNNKFGSKEGNFYSTLFKEVEKI